MNQRRALALTLTALALLGAGCSSDGGNAGAGSQEGAELTVLGAASLTGSFTDLAATFEDDHPGVSVRLSFDSSATLAEQVVQGAPADVLATADTKTMDGVLAADAVDGSPDIFATNTLVMVVPKDNPAGITKFADLQRNAASYVMCVETAPCGALTTQVLDANGTTVEAKSQEIDVKAVLGKVELGEADAGFVYETDAVAAGDKVDTVAIPNAADFVNQYPVAVVADAAEPGLARDWVDLVLSAEGQQVLADAGFGKP